ncbi:MAG: membrane protein insertion efficiency factor YidD [Candidatus Sungbacteria bacterium RIFCSPLOWO2_02_FULL_47_9]|uniref:Putative membrane protein insertion efficiency factor n=1 Tax=Candidatus Sungbacteria bacterium RIFCSPHIGHO2_01_FULL_47_32 TaxID=1802264 RepID=A0A1G2K5K7_9BACT|nr:MAG: hypothetical protein UX72_C0021G0026 [Parcubacteria group bacterium GW2011_GWA2_47_10]OGZ93760.1 MAG: membrane protein insertion efficiency factor YidD [Candidatus Sungbacteria bacterium RIFCSPHIGHO2_01_FULL_47_32]OHA00034.1 MAG: membrane protein insertion efficiency factor YidD [Candidatus Sungbacteria bacterium RIFCSPHIGHO2_02_FULL_46_12]OHA05133.1 MAG: membrane protein insertion efficiency factor YidD [Candidatus Sungbacteria bacterium RIFCSPLOWO2_01_FULL_47_32]OHA08471.1 MAG: membra
MERTKKIFLFCIKLYQKTLSPDHGGIFSVLPYFRCRFYPSCSVYAEESIRQYGLIDGIIASLKRIVRCNPLHPGGYDPVVR